MKLQNRLKEIKEKDLVSFHYPGHKGHQVGFSGNNLFDFDTTETIGTDNLLLPTDIIKESQEWAARTYGTMDTFYGVGGSTMANYTALFSLAEEGDHVLIQRNSHLSLYQAAYLRKVKVHTINPSYNEDWGILLSVDPEELDKTLEENPEINVVTLTSPTIFGVISNLKELVEIAHKHDVKVLVDEAHGAHLNFTHLRDVSGIAAGADMVVQSAHKFLGAMTMTSLLHRNTEAVSQEKVQHYFRLFTSTSPSYILMVSTEGAIADMEAKTQEERDDFLARVRSFRAKAEAMGFEVFKEGEPYDFTKFVVRYPGYTGEELLEEFYKRGINLEFSQGNNAVAIFSIYNREEDFERFLAAMADMPKKEGIFEKGVFTSLPQIKKMEIYEVFDKDGTFVPVEESEGQIVTNLIYEYPPGIPLLLPGEILTQEHIEKILNTEGIEGVIDGKVNVL